MLFVITSPAVTRAYIFVQAAKRSWLKTAVYEELEQGKAGDIFVEFYSNLAKVYDKQKFRCQDI